MNWGVQPPPQPPAIPTLRISLACSIVFLFVQIETGAGAKNIEICHIAIENDLAVRRFHAVASH